MQKFNIFLGRSEDSWIPRFLKEYLWTLREGAGGEGRKGKAWMGSWEQPEMPNTGMQNVGPECPVSSAFWGSSFRPKCV